MDVSSRLHRRFLVRGEYLVEMQLRKATVLPAYLCVIHTASRCGIESNARSALRCGTILGRFDAVEHGVLFVEKGERSSALLSSQIDLSEY